MNWEDVILDAAVTDTGMRRSNNQDSHTIARSANPQAWRQRGHVFMVADGMGAHAVGELASKMACDNIPHHYMKLKNATPVEAITKAYKDVGALIHGKASANKDFQGMGTTCSTLVLLPNGALIAHVGDSRVYRVRGHRIDQLSFDHSLVWELVRRNHLSPEQAARAVPRNVITRSLGPDPVVEVDIEGPLAIEPGDVFVLCSDGLSGPVTDPEIGAFGFNFHPEDACRYLLHLANLRGGHDNITAITVRVGPWVEPGSVGSSTLDAESDAQPAHKEKRVSRFSRLLPAINTKLLPVLGRRPEPEPVEEHRYVSCECPLDERMVERITEEVRNAQALAVDQAWSLDWPALASYRQNAYEARAHGDLRKALKELGEAIVLLGVAGRINKMEQDDDNAPTPVPPRH